MKRVKVVGVAIAAALVLVVLVAVALGRRVRESRSSSAARTTVTSTETHPASDDAGGFLHGRIGTTDGASYEGRLRWGDEEEAFWGDYFNGHKVDVDRPFMARFGDIVRIEARDGEILVTLKSGAVFRLDRSSADDLADGVWVWDATRGAARFDERRIRTIELFPASTPGDAPYRLHGTVRTRQGEFTGFVQWNRKACVGTDELNGRTADGRLGLRFDTIRSIVRTARGGSRVTLLDGREFALSGTREVGNGNLGLYVEDRRYGRVLVPWDAFVRVDFSPAGSGPAFGDFPTGGPITGTVSTRAGRRFTGRLIYDLDERETTETLDAPSGGVHYTIPFGLIASIVPSGRVTLHSGEELQLERSGDLGEENAGTQVFVEGGSGPEYVPWSEVERIELDRPPATYPPIDGTAQVSVNRTRARPARRESTIESSAR